MSERTHVTEGGSAAAGSARAKVELTVARVLLLQGLGLLAVVLVGAGIFALWHQSYYYYSTDDAMVSGTVATAAPLVSGTVADIVRQVGDVVQAGQTLGTVRTATGTSAVVSPITGTIFSLTATPGELLSGGEPLAQVVDLRSVYVTAYVDEQTVRDVHLGQSVDVTVDGESMHGTVRLITPVTAGETSLLPTTDYADGNFTAVDQRVPVRIGIYGANGHLIYPGESASVTIHLHDNT